MMDSPAVSKDIYSSGDNDADNIAKLLDLIPELSKSYDIVRSIGHGTFSRVYLAELKKKSHRQQLDSKMLALKHIIPTSHPSRVYMELKCMQKLGGVDNVVGVWACHRQLNHIALAMPYFPHDSTSEYMGCLNVPELRDYLGNLLVAVRHIHKHNILHRDIKPANFLYHRATNRYCLVDFGLAQEIGVHKILSSRRYAGKQLLQQHAAVASKARPPTPLPPTPHLHAARPVKRKLTVDLCSTVEPSSKRVKATSHPASTSGVLLTASSSRLNIIPAGTTALPHNLAGAGVRQSPRKSVQRSSKKENSDDASASPAAPGATVTPRKHQATITAAQAQYLHDSPSKHTRLAESTRRLDEGQQQHCDTDGGVERLCGPAPKLKTTRSRRHLLAAAAAEDDIPHHASLPTNINDNTCNKNNNTSNITDCCNATTTISGDHSTKHTTPIANNLTDSGTASNNCSNRHAITGAEKSMKHNNVSLTSVNGVNTTSFSANGVVKNDNKDPNSSRTLYTTSTATATAASYRVKSDLRSSSDSGVGCRCYGRGQQCRRCSSRPHQVAPRAGTPGFRPPEVLMRHPHQGTGVDMWSCGVVMLCVTSGRHPFFKAPDDQTALAELCTIFSTKALRKTAAIAFEKLFVSNVDRVAVDLRKTCETLRLSCCVTAEEHQLEHGKPCAKCLQTRVCVCQINKTNVLIDHLDNEEQNDENELKYFNGTKSTVKQAAGNESGGNSPTVNYLNKLSRRVAGFPATVSPMRGRKLADKFDSPGKDVNAVPCSPKLADSPLRCSRRGANVNSLVKCKLDLKAEIKTEPEGEINNSPSINEALKETDGQKLTTAACQVQRASPHASKTVVANNMKMRDKFEESEAPAARHRHSKPKPPPLYSSLYPSSVYHLMERLLDLNPNTRISAEDALKHPFLAGAKINS